MPTSNTSVINITRSAEETDTESSEKSLRRPSKYTSTDWRRNGDEVNEEMLYKSVLKAGSWAYGVSVVEVWTLREEDNTLYRPAGGYWRDPVFEPSEALKRIEDKTREDYVPPHSLGPGEGLAGVLWSETRDPRNFRAFLQDNFGLKTESFRGLVSHPQASGDVENNLATTEQIGREANEDYDKVAWRFVNALADDPDQPPNERLRLLGEAGFGLAAGVLFNVRGHRGIVVYMARATVNTERLQSATNEAYMRSAADLIGAESALSVTRKASIEQRALEKQATILRCKQKMRALAGISDGTTCGKITLPIDLADICADKPCSEIPNAESLTNGLSYTEKLSVWMKKGKGRGVRPPPPMPFTQAGWALLGSFTIMAITMNLLQVISSASNGKYQIPGAVYASMACLSYGLTAAPSGQPRTMLLGKLISISLTIVFGYIVKGRLEMWLHLSLVTSIVVATMVKLGIAHPPAAAMSIIFALGEKGWVDVAVVMVIDMVTIVVSTMINNMSSKRQYPVYWAFFDFHVGWNAPIEEEKEKSVAEAKKP